MRHFTVARIQITDPSWIGEYVKRVTPMVEAAGGRYLARTSQVVHLEGEPSPGSVALLIEWPSRGAAERFYASEAYAPFLRQRLAGSECETLLVAGVDDTSSASTL